MKTQMFLRENAVVTKVCCGRVLRLFLPVCARRSWYRLSLVQGPEARILLGMGAHRKKRLGLGSHRLTDSFEKG